MVQWDRANEFSREDWKRCGEFGLQGLPAPKAYEGMGVDTVTTMLALEALGYGCTDNGRVFSINAHLWTSVIPPGSSGRRSTERAGCPGVARVSSSIATPSPSQRQDLIPSR